MNRKNTSQPISVTTEDGERCTYRSYEARHDRSAKPRRMEALPQVLRSRRLYEGRVFSVRADDLRYSDGTEHRVDVVEHGASLAIVATPAPNELVLVRQYRHPVRSLLWEVPAGTAELGESPVEGAKRELREETGYRAGRIRPIGSVWMTPGFCSEIMHFFTPTNWSRAKRPATTTNALKSVDLRIRRQDGWSLREQPTQRRCWLYVGCRAKEIKLEVTSVDSYCR